MSDMTKRPEIEMSNAAARGLSDNPSLKEFAAEERALARRARDEIKASSKVQGTTRVSLARNFGKILGRFGRELSRDELVRIALKTDNIKPSERLGRYQILPGREVTPSKETHLSKNPKNYLKLAVTTARLSGHDEDRYVLELVDGTKFDPKMMGDDIRDLRPAERLAEIIRGKTELIATKYGVVDYMELRRRYKARDIIKRDGSYEFRVERDFWAVDNDYIQPVSITTLFSINVSSGFCEWREPGVEWLRRPIEIEERVGFGIYVGEDHGIFGAFVISPKFFLPKVQKKKLPEIKSTNVPIDLKRPWVVHPMSGGYRVRIDDHGTVKPSDLKDYEKNVSPPRPLNIVRLPSDHGLNVKYFRDTWSKRLRSIGMHKSGDPNFKTNMSMTSPILDPVSISSVSTWLDRPVETIRRRRGDAFTFEGTGVDPSDGRLKGSTAPKFDASRGLSPPDTMMAEVEVALCYGGFQGWFDEVINEINEDGEYIPTHRTYDATSDDTFLDLIENDIAAQTKTFESWLESIQGETRKRSDDLLRRIDEELKSEKALLAKPKEQ
jgi:hypothetical protein